MVHDFNLLAQGFCLLAHDLSEQAHNCVSWYVTVLFYYDFCLSIYIYHLVGLVVKASASRAEGPGFESRLRPDFFGVESYQ